jgi:hypothetical protein
MKKALLLSFVALLLAGTAPNWADDNTQTMTGEYRRLNERSRGEVKSVFTSTGEGTWTVSFHFDYRKKPHIYTGTAAGSLTDGKLSGKVLNEDQSRTFTFEGTVENGAFRGTHAEVGGGEARKTGTLTLGG